MLLYKWKPIFAWLPTEALIRERQDAYYAALGQADISADATPFVEFLLSVIYGCRRPAADKRVSAGKIALLCRAQPNGNRSINQKAWGEFPQQAAGEISGCRKSPCSSSLYKRRHYLPSVTAQTRLLLFNKCLWLYKQKIKSHHSSAKSATSLTSLTARASWSLFSSPVFCSMFATWNLTVDISQPISAAMRV